MKKSHHGDTEFTELHGELPFVVGAIFPATSL